MKSTHILAAVLVSAFALPVFAQSAGPNGALNQQNQEARIQQGVRTGALTAPEAQRLEQRESHITSLKQSARADGVVTAREHRKIKRAEARTSRAIYRKKHNAAHA
jgi:hypothetical protein